MDKDLNINEENDNTEAAEGKVTPEVDSKYRMILLAAQRSKQLQRGANPRVSADVRKTKPTRIAMEELKHKKIHFEFTKDEDEETKDSE